MKSDDAPVIDVPARSGLRGRMDRLQQTYMQKATALQIAIEILDADDRATAQALAPKKFQQAITHRTGIAPEAPLDSRAMVAQYVGEHPGATTREIALGIGRSDAMVLKYIWEFAKPIKKHKRGSGKAFRWIAKEDASSPSAPATQKKRTKKINRASSQERLDTVTAYLLKHPGATTNDMADALGWKRNQAWKYVKMVARGEGGNNPHNPMKWYLRAAKTSKKAKAKATVKTTRANGKISGRTKSRAEWQAEVKAYLATHPEAFTVEIAKALRRTPNSGFVRMIRTVAKPARETIATQPIPWVLTEA